MEILKLLYSTEARTGMKNLTKIEPETKLLEHMPTGELNKTKLK
jgi:hypothetical protein